AVLVTAGDTGAFQIRQSATLRLTTASGGVLLPVRPGEDAETGSFADGANDAHTYEMSMLVRKA
ncbi:hypothetical protein AB4043_21410, partial [Terriglobus sp. YAF25]|uniref:hypothetical protein n=1 Tax=Terriglobus sp. YAF25 TaxID=3233080 RepID=UPI003F9C240D